MALAGAPLVPQLAGATAHHTGTGGIDGKLLEATVLELQEAMARSRVSSAEITQFYLDRIAELNPAARRGDRDEPGRHRDRRASATRERRRRPRARAAARHPGAAQGQHRHRTTRMQTTAGSLALVGVAVPHDALARRRGCATAGAVILGKANLHRVGQFPRSFALDSTAGAAAAGFTRNPYDLSTRIPCGSSSGSAVAAAANLARGRGRHRDGRLDRRARRPSNARRRHQADGGPGRRRTGIIPIAHTQDTAGPMCRTVTDVALLLGVLQIAVRRGSRVTACRTTTAPVPRRRRARRCASRLRPPLRRRGISGRETTICLRSSTRRSGRCAQPER